MQGPIDEATDDSICKALIFMREHAREDPEIEGYVDVATQCLQSVFHVRPNYQAARDQDALSLALDVQRSIQLNPSMSSTSDSPPTPGLDSTSASTSMSGLPYKRVRFNPEVMIREVEPRSSSIYRSDRAIRHEAEENINLGHRLCALKRYAEAINHYNRAIELRPLDADYYYNRAVASSYQKNYLQCMEDCIEAIRLDSKHRKAYGQLGLSYCHLLDFENAQAALMQSLEFQGRNKVYKKLLELVNRKLESSDSLASSIEDDPEFQDAFEAILALDVQRDQESDPSMPSTSASTSTFDLSYIPSSPSTSGLPSKRVRFNPEVVTHEVDSRASVSRSDRTLRQVAENNTYQGHRLCALKQYSEAIIHYNKAIELIPLHADYYYNRAVAFSYQKNYVRCMTDCIKAMGCDPTHRKAYGRLGLSYCHLLDFENAQTALIQALEFQGRNKAYKRLLELVNKKLDSSASDSRAFSIEDDPEFQEAFEALEMECHPEFV